MADNKVLIEIGVDKNKALTDLTAANTQVKALRDANKELSKEYEKNATQIALNNAEIKNLNQTITAANRIIQEENKQVTNVDGAYAKLNLEYQVAAQRAKDLAAAQGVNSEEAKKAQSVANGLNQQLKDIDKTVGQNQRSVGDYGIATKGLGKTFEDIKGKSDAMKNGFIGVFNSIGQAKNPLDLFKKGIDTTGLSMEMLSKNPIIATITILVGLFNAVKDSIGSSSKATNTLKEAMAPVNALMTVLKNTTVAIVQVFLDAFLAVSKFATAMYSLISSNDKYTKSVKDAMAVEKERQTIAKLNRQLIVEEAEGNLRVAQLRDKVTEKDKYTRKQREGFLREAIEIEKQMAGEKVKIATMEYNNLVKQLRSKAELSSDEKKQLAEAQAKMYNVQTEYYQSVRRMKTQANNFNKQEDDAELQRQQNDLDVKIKAKEKAEKKAEQLREQGRKAEEKRISEAEKNAQKEIALAEKKMNLAIKALNDEITLDKLRQEEILAGQKLTNEEILNINNERLIKERNMRLEAANLEIQESKDNITTLENEKSALLKERQTAEVQAKIANIDEQQAIELQKQQDFETEKSIIIQDANTQIAINNAEFDQKETDRKNAVAATDLQNKLAIAEIEGQSLYDLKVQQLEQQKQAELLAAESSGADKAIIEAKYVAMSKDLAKKENDNKLSLYSSFASNIANIFGKNSKVGKMAAVASATIDTYKGAQAAFSSLAGIPIVGPALGAVAAGAAIASGIANVKSILNTKSGLPGDSGGGGSTPSANAVASATIPTSITGGIVSRTTEANNTEAQTKNAVNSAMKDNPVQPVLVTNDLTTALDQKVQIKTSNSL